ncbi:uncharacterized protein LOC135461903 [Liolophura sinensis]|uniref:uncharacterized protein LOC135461903 n=1 Tax=Liolophura sinensis TaxID=3198878 RepID=UPI0031588DB6
MNQLSVVTKNGRTCTEMSAEERLQADTEASNYLAIGVGVGVAVLVLIIVIIIVTVVVLKRRSEDKELPGLSMADGIQITPVGIDGHHYENVPTPTDVNYITVIADPVGTVRSNLVTGNYNDLYSNNKIIKSKNIYNDTSSSNADNISLELNENLCKVAMKPQNRELVIPEVRRSRRPYETYSTQATVVTPGVRSDDYDTYNMLWDKINKDIEAIKPTLKSHGSKVVEVSRTLSGGSNYDHLGEKPAGAMLHGDTSDYNHIYDRSGQTSF